MRLKTIVQFYFCTDNEEQQNLNSLLEITIADKDINEAIDDMAITSTPGPEGITTTIYQEYPD